MDQNKAYEILGLKQDSDKDEIIKRYNMLLRRYKEVKTEEEKNTFDEITRAYNILMGYDYIDPTAEQTIKQKLENPNPILKKLNINQLRFENFIYYNKSIMIISIIAFLVLFFSIRSCIMRVPSELDIDFIGNVICDTESFELKAAQELNLNKVNANIVFFQEKDLGSEVGGYLLQKIFLELSVADIDIYIVDANIYDQYSEQGVFLPLEEIINEIGVDETLYKDLKRSRTERDIEGNILVKEEERVYGVDVTNSKFLVDNGIKGEKLILTFRFKQKNPENAKAFFIKCFE